MVQIDEVVILSVDKSEQIWSVEGEVTFEGDLTTPFSADYDTEDDELINFEMEINPGKYDKNILKGMIIESAEDFDE